MKARSRSVNRSWWPSLAGVAAAAAVLVVAFTYQQANRPSSGTVMERAVALFNGELHGLESGWRDTAPPRSYPFSAAVRLFADVQWRPIDGPLDTPGVVYRLRSNHITSVLYVLNGPVADLPSAPPVHPARSTANCSACVWQENGLMYVLVVQGDWRAYQFFLDLPQGPVA